MASVAAVEVSTGGASCGPGGASFKAGGASSVARASAPGPCESTHRAIRTHRGRKRWLVLGLAVVLALAVLSLFVGVGHVSPSALINDDGHARDLLLLSRLPRTAAILLAGSASAVAGVVMQLMVRNRFVEPSTVGTTEAAQAGLLVTALLAPAMPIAGRMGVAAVFALAGTALFLALLRAIPLRSAVTTPLIGIMLAGIIGATTTFFAFQFDLLQTLNSWTTGCFSGVIAGRFEMLWIVGALAIVVYLVADRFTVAGLGRDTATSLGLSYNAVRNLGLAIVATTAAVVVVVVGALPFLGLVVPNVVSMFAGDNLRRTLPWVALGGAGLVLVCDLIARTIAAPFELPIGAVMGVFCGAFFLVLLLRRGRNV